MVSGLRNCYCFCWILPHRVSFFCQTKDPYGSRRERARWGVAGLVPLWGAAGSPGRCRGEGDLHVLVQGQGWVGRGAAELRCRSVLGLQEMEAGNLPAALSLLQEAAGGLCSKGVLAQIYTCLGCCARQMVMAKPLPCWQEKGNSKELHGEAQAVCAASLWS